MKVMPLGDRILVKTVEAKETTKGGIIIPTTGKERPEEGTVVALGPGRLAEGKRTPFDVAKGDRILFVKYAGNEVVIDGEKHLLMREEDILAILK